MSFTPYFPCSSQIDCTTSPLEILELIFWCFVVVLFQFLSLFLYFSFQFILVFSFQFILVFSLSFYNCLLNIFFFLLQGHSLSNTVHFFFYFFSSISFSQFLALSFKITPSLQYRKKNCYQKNDKSLLVKAEINSVVSINFGYAILLTNGTKLFCNILSMTSGKLNYKYIQSCLIRIAYTFLTFFPRIRASLYSVLNYTIIILFFVYL